MDKSFYKKEVISLQGLFEKFSAIQFDLDLNKSGVKDKSTHSMGGLFVAMIIGVLVLGMVGFLTMWLIN